MTVCMTSELNSRLQEAVAQGLASEVIDLLDQGADIDARDEAGGTALHHAAWNGRLETLLVLLERGAATSPVDDSGFMPLHFSAAGQEEALSLALMAAGSDRVSDAFIAKRSTSMRRILKLDTLHAAAEVGNMALLRRAVEGPEIQALSAIAQAKRFEAAAQHAIKKGQPQAGAYLQACQARCAVNSRSAEVRPL